MHLFFISCLVKLFICGFVFRLYFVHFEICFCLCSFSHYLFEIYPLLLYSVNFVLFGPIWFYSIHFDPIQSTLIYSVYIGSIWSTLVLFGMRQSYSVHFGQVWSYSINFGPIRSIKSYSIYFCPIGPLWSYSVLISPILFYSIHLKDFFFGGGGWGWKKINPLWCYLFHFNPIRYMHQAIICINFDLTFYIWNDFSTFYMDGLMHVWLWMSKNYPGVL